MAETLLTCTPTACNAAFPADSRIRPRIAGATILGLQAVYTDANGVAQLASAGAAGTKQFRGVALPRTNLGAAAGGAGQGIDVLEEGEVNGVDLSGLAFDALVYLGDTAGALSSTAGTATVVVGRVVATSTRDSSGVPKKALYVRSQMVTNW